MNYSKLKTQADIKKYTKQILDNIKINNDIKKIYPIEYKFFTTFLFPRHPEYPVKIKNMNNIFTSLDMRKQIQVYIINSDRSIDNVSALNKCITGKSKDKLTVAMRNAIDNQTKNYRKTCNIHKCVICCSTGALDVDHFEPSFKILKEEFIKTTNYPIPNIVDNDNGEKVFDNTQHSDFFIEWILYHDYNKNLRMLCKSCNQKYK